MTAETGDSAGADTSTHGFGSMPSTNTPIKPSAASTGLTLTATTLLTIGAITLPFLRSYSGAPYVASSAIAQRTIREFLTSHRQKLLPRKPGLIDLGSGSGEHVLCAAGLGYRAIGVERNPWLVQYSRFHAWKDGSDARFVKEDLWDVDVGEYDVVVVFGVPGMMERVKQKLERECGEGCVVCSHTFEIPSWKEQWQEGGVRFYRVGEQHMRQRGGLQSEYCTLENEKLSTKI